MIEIETGIIDYFEPRKNIIAVYLFGSRCAGTQRIFSDLDIGIVSDPGELKTTLSNFTRYMTDLGRISRKDVHLVLLNTAGEALMEQVYKKGRCLLINDEKKLAQFQMMSLSKIMDFSYLRRQMQSGLIKTIMES